MPIIIWGSRGLTSTLSSGHFHCPRCQETRGYTLNSVRRYFTIYWIPLFPIGGETRYVECSRFGGTYKEMVREMEPEAGEERQLSDIYGRLRDGVAVESVRPRLQGLGYNADQVEEVLTKMCDGPPKKCACGLGYHPSATKCTECGARL